MSRLVEKKDFIWQCLQGLSRTRSMFSFSSDFDKAHNAALKCARICP